MSCWILESLLHCWWLFFLSHQGVEGLPGLPGKPGRRGPRVSISHSEWHFSLLLLTGRSITILASTYIQKYCKSIVSSFVISWLNFIWQRCKVSNDCIDVVDLYVLFKYPDTSLDYGSLFSQAFVCFGSGCVQAVPLHCQKLPVKPESKRAKATNLWAANVKLIKGACSGKLTDLENQCTRTCMSEALRLSPCQ